MTSLDLLIVGLTMLTLANYWFKRSVLYPPFLFCSVWLLDISIYRLGLMDLNPLHDITCYVIFIGAVLFSFGGVLGYLCPQKIIDAQLIPFNEPKSSGRWFAWLIIVLLAAGLFDNIRSAVALAGGITSPNGVFWAVAAKESIDELNANGGSVHVGNYIGNWSVFLAVLLLAEGFSRLGLLAAGIAFLSCVTSGGRGGLFLLASALITLYLIRTGRERFGAAFRSVRLPVLGFLVLFSLLFFINKGVSTGDTNVLIAARDVMVQYIVGAVAALDHVLTHLTDYANVPNHTFQIFLKGLSSSGLISYTPPPPLDEWVYVPFGTNVYTIYKPYIVDFGVAIGVSWMGFIGFFHCLLFRKAHAKSTLGLFVFALTVYSIFMVIFDDEYSRFGMYGSAFLFGIAYLSVKAFRWTVFRHAGSAMKTVKAGRLRKIRISMPLPALRIRLRQHRPIQ